MFTENIFLFCSFENVEACSVRLSNRITFSLICMNRGVRVFRLPEIKFKWQRNIGLLSKFYLEINKYLYLSLFLLSKYINDDSMVWIFLTNDTDPFYFILTENFSLSFSHLTSRFVKHILFNIFLFAFFCIFIHNRFIAVNAFQLVLSADERLHSDIADELVCGYFKQATRFSKYFDIVNYHSNNHHCWI